MAAMDRAAVEALLAEPRLLVLAVGRGADAPFVAPVWYEYHDGRFAIWTNHPTAKTRLAARSPAVTLCVQSEERPYRAVLVRGSATVIAGRDRDLIRRLAVRYLGDAEGNAYADAAIAGATDESQATIVVAPVRWRAWDYAVGDADDPRWVADRDLR